MNIECSLRTQTAVTEQLVKSQEEAAGETQQSLSDMRKEVEDVRQVIDTQMAKEPVMGTVQSLRMVKYSINSKDTTILFSNCEFKFEPDVEKNDATIYMEDCTEKGHSSTYLEYYDADSSDGFVMNSRAYYN